jgi:hypothetical protein
MGTTAAEERPDSPTNRDPRGEKETHPKAETQLARIE